MGQEPSTERAAIDPDEGAPTEVHPSDPDQIRAEIEETRRELGDTVAALSAKTDVKAQARARITDTKAAIGDRRDEVVGKAREISPDSALAAASTGTQKARENPVPLAVAGAFVAGLLIGRLLRRRDS
jgi:ElaB/YqjD/DUF883 family membrane-anchored ribosome-binding protein